jgi:hypothetical protein
MSDSMREWGANARLNPTTHQSPEKWAGTPLTDVLRATIANLETENAALKARITELESRQITEHGTVEFGGVTWRFYRSDERENDRGHWATNELEPFGVFIWARNNGFYINADEYGAVNFSSVFAAMQAAIEYAKGDSNA